MSEKVILSKERVDHDDSTHSALLGHDAVQSTDWVWNSIPGTGVTTPDLIGMLPGAHSGAIHSTGLSLDTPALWRLSRPRAKVSTTLWRCTGRVEV
jgi:hypothetical protein